MGSWKRFLFPPFAKQSVEAVPEHGTQHGNGFGVSVTMAELGGMKTQILRQMIQSLKGTGINPSTSGWYCGLKSYHGQPLS